MTLFSQQTEVILILLSVTGMLGYVINEHFWRSHYARNNSDGLAEGPYGGVIVWISGSMIGFFLSLFIGPFFMDKESAAMVAIACLYFGAVTGYFPMAKGRSKS